MYSRSLDGRILSITPSGWTYGKQKNRSLFVLMDKETETLWFHREREDSSGLVGIAGPLRDRFLPYLASLERTTWGEWKRRFPDATFVTGPEEG